MKFSIYLALWGKEYIDYFFEEILPVHFSPGNLYAFSEQNCFVEFVFYTLPHDLDIFSSYASYQQLQRIMPVSIKAINTRHTDKFYIMAQLHNLTILDAQRKSSTMIFFFADVIFSEGFFSRLIALRLKGYRAVLTFALLVNKEEFVQSYQLASGRKFSQHALSHIHKEVITHHWDNKLVCDVPNSFVLQSGDTLYCIHSFHWTPIMIAPEVKGIQPYYTIDVDFIRRACPNYEKIYCIKDSDDLPMVSLSAKNEIRQKTHLRKDSIAKFFAQWSIVGADQMHLRLFKESICYHSQDLDGEYEILVKKSEHIVKKILAYRSRLKNIFEKIRDLINNRKLIVFGASTPGLFFTRTVIHYDLYVDAIFDNDTNKWGLSFGPVAVVKPDYSCFQDIFIVVVADRHIEISQQLIAQGLIRGKHFLVAKIKQTSSVDMEFVSEDID